MSADLNVAELLDAVERRSVEIGHALSTMTEVELRAPSLLPDWDRLTIACHLRYGAEALFRMTDDTVAGRDTAYYPGGRQAQRPGTLRPRRDETPADVVEALRTTSSVLQGSWRAMAGPQWGLRISEPSGGADLGPLPLRQLVLLRLTEVEVHGSDLDAGLADWSAAFVDAALPFRLGWLNHRRTNHRDFDRHLAGSWLLKARDAGLSYLVEVSGPDVRAAPAPAGASATATIEAPARDLLALLLGRPLRTAPSVHGDHDFADAFTRAFPGP